MPASAQVTWSSLGTGTGALLGGDLTDPENDGNDVAGAEADLPGNNWNFIDAIPNEERGFEGGEFALNIFDNKLGGGNDKWCCNARDITVVFAQPYHLTHFTISSANDTPNRDWNVWRVMGSNDGVTFDTIYEYTDGVRLWNSRLEVLRFDLDAPTATSYTHFRFEADSNWGDGLWQIGEIEIFGLPNLDDTDGDGMPDTYEDNNGLDKNDASDAASDGDGDGLTALEEYNAGTDPQVADTDGDGLSDGAEINTHSTDPLNSDGDADGLKDGVEINTHSTDPANPDSDGDSFRDGQEVALGTDPNSTASTPGPLASGMLGYWSFDAAAMDLDGDFAGADSDPDLVDLSGNANHGTFRNPGFGGIVVDESNPTTPAKFGEAIRLEGAGNQYFQIDGNPPAGADIAVTTFAQQADDLSVSIWASVSSFTKNWQCLIAKGEGGCWRFHRRGGEARMAYFGGITDLSGNGDVNDGNLHHFVIQTVENATSIVPQGTYLWQDGVLIASAAGSPNVCRDRNDAHMMIGANPHDVNGRTWDGVVDDAAYWTRPLNPGEIQWIYNNGDGRSIGSILAAPDTDGDGLLDDQEAFLGTDPNVADSEGDLDGDGLSNWDEFFWGLDANDPDGDGDGLNDGGEVAAGTDPFNPDTDGDGINDGDEVSGALNPFSNEATNPLSADSDGDGLTDNEEITGSRNVNFASAPSNPNAADTDGDTFGDVIEIAEGTDPNDDQSVPVFTPLQPSFNPIGGVGMIPDAYVTGDPGLNYEENQYAGGVIFNNNARNNYDVHTTGVPAPLQSNRDIVPYLDHGGGGTTISSHNLPFIVGGDNFTVRVNGYVDFTRFTPGTYTIHLGADDTNYFVMNTHDGDVVSEHNCCPQDNQFQFTLTRVGIFPFDNVFGEQGGGDWTDLGISGPGIVGTVALGDVAAGSPPVHTIALSAADPDGDGLPTWYEAQYGHLDPGLDNSNDDFDGDGLSEPAEFQNGTDPTLADTDADGISDGDEINVSSTDPLNDDSDGDGVKDGDEVNTHGTDPNNADSDGDTVSDGAEVAGGSDPLDAGDYPPIPAPLLFYNFDNLAGNDPLSDVTDWSGNDNHGLIADPAAITVGSEGAPGGSSPSAGAFFNGSVVNVPGIDAPSQLANRNSNPDGSYTMAAWIKPGDSAGGEGFFWGQTNQGIHHGIRNGGRLHTAHWGADYNANTVLSRDVWVHATWTYDGPTDTARIYLNGVLDGGPFTQIAPQGDGHLVVGARNGNGNGGDGEAHYRGLADDVAVWQGVLSEVYIQELATGSSPLEELLTVDADSDGLPDLWEQQNAVSDPAADDDGDGLDNAGEYAAGTNPNDPDSDGDGLNDGDEVSGALNVAFSNEATDPLRSDSDGDGASDSEEVSGSLNLSFGNAPTNPNAFDTDSDTIADSVEFGEGSDPNDGGSTPNFVTVAPTFNPMLGPGAGFGAYAPGEPGLNFEENQYAGGVIFNNDATNNYNVHTSGTPAPLASVQAIQPYLDHGPGGNTISTHNLPFLRDSNPGLGFTSENFTVRVHGYVDFRTFLPGTYTIHLGADDTNYFVMDTLDGQVASQHNCCPQDFRTSFTITRVGLFPFDNVFGEQGGGDWSDLGISGPGITGIVALGDVDAGSPPILTIALDTTDTDGDGLPDWYENLPGNPHLDPNVDNSNDDQDSDGLLEPGEFLAGTDPNVADTDGDGLTDGAEVNSHGSNPLAFDTDGDGLSDGDEVNVHGTDPTSGDSDGDRFTDAEEVALGSDPNDAASTPAKELVIYYPFDNDDPTASADAENLGTSVTPGLFTGASVIKPSDNVFNGGDYGGAWQGNRLDANDAYVDTGFTGTQLPLGGDAYTSMGWVLWSGPGGGEDHMVFGSNAGDGVGGQLHQGIRANNNGVDDGHMGHWGNDVGDAGTVPIGVWTHMAFTYGSGTSTVWINGVPVKSANVGPLGNPDLNISVGFTRHGSFHGCLDEVKVFDRALKDFEIQEEMNAPSLAPSAELVLTILGYDAGAGMLRVDVTNVPAAGTFHLRQSTDGENFTPDLGFDFDSSTAFPVDIPVDPAAEAIELFQVFSGPSIPIVAQEIFSEDFNADDGLFTSETYNPLVSNASGPWGWGATAGAGGTGGWSANGGEGGNVGPFEQHLTSPAINIPADGPVTLSFEHSYNFEFNWDGGLVEVSVNGGPFTQVLDFTQNGYVDMIQVADADWGYPNDMNGLPTFGGTSGTFLTSICNLGNLTTGDMVQVRFRAGWDWFTVNGAPNWVVDNVKLSQ